MEQKLSENQKTHYTKFLAAHTPCAGFRTRSVRTTLPLRSCIVI